MNGTEEGSTGKMPVHNGTLDASPRSRKRGVTIVMERRHFLSRTVGGGLALSAAAVPQEPTPNRQRSNLPPGTSPSAWSVPRGPGSPMLTPDYLTYADDLVIEGD